MEWLYLVFEFTFNITYFQRIRHLVYAFVFSVSYTKYVFSVVESSYFHIELSAKDPYRYHLGARKRRFFWHQGNACMGLWYQALYENSYFLLH